MRIITGALCGVVSLASVAGASNEVVQLPLVTVTEDRPSLTAPGVAAARAEIAAVPGGANVVVAEEFLGGRARTLEDALAWTPGVLAQDRNEGVEVRLSMRGSALDRGYHLRGIKLLQDGVPVSFADGNGDFQNLEPLTMQYLEVWRGANALRFGATTLGGAINAVSLTGRDAAQVQVRGEAGSWDTYRGQVSSGGVWTEGDYCVSLSGDHRLGYQAHSESSAERIAGNIGWRLSDTVETRFYAGFAHSESELPGNLTKSEIKNSPRTADPSAVTFDQERNADWARLANKTVWQPDDAHRLEAAVYWSYQKLDHPLFWNPFFLNGLGVLDDESHTGGADFRYTGEGEWAGRRNVLVVGFAPAATWLEDRRFANLNGRRGALVADGKFTAVSLDLYGENQHYVTEKFSVIVGAQVSYAGRDFNDEFVTDPNGDQSRDRDYLGFNPKLGVIYEWAQGRQVFANVSRSFEPPTSIEMLQLGGPAGDILSAKLDAQTATTIEIGTRGEQGRFRWDVAYYYAWVEDELLTLNDAGGNPLGTVNGPATYHQGVELGAAVELLRGITARDAGDKVVLQSIYNWSDFRFRDSAVYGRNRLPGIPEHTLRTELVYQHPVGFYVGPNVAWVPVKYPADYANSLDADPHFTIGAKIGYRPRRGPAIYFEARNLTDERYASATEPIADASASFGPPRVFHPGEGRSFYGGVEWKW